MQLPFKQKETSSILVRPTRGPQLEGRATGSYPEGDEFNSLRTHFIFGRRLAAGRQILALSTVVRIHPPELPGKPGENLENLKGLGPHPRHEPRKAARPLLFVEESRGESRSAPRAFTDSQEVRQAAVNRPIVGSIPTR